MNVQQHSLNSGDGDHSPVPASASGAGGRDGARPSSAGGDRRAEIHNAVHAGERFDAWVIAGGLASYGVAVLGVGAIVAAMLG